MGSLLSKLITGDDVMCTFKHNFKVLSFIFIHLYEKVIKSIIICFLSFSVPESVLLLKIWHDHSNFYKGKNLIGDGL